VHDMAVATYAAAGINLAVVLIAFAVAARTSYSPARDGTGSSRPRQRPGARLVFFAIALSGMCALGAEVVWTRLLSLLLGATVYTFSIILAVFLLGIGVGSQAGAVVIRSIANARVA